MANKYKIRSLKGREDLHVSRVGGDTLEFKIGNKAVTVFTEDLAALVREELPQDRARVMFSEIEEKELLKGKARVTVKADTDIKKGDYVRFTIDINKYLDRHGNPFAVRTSASGFIF